MKLATTTVSLEGYGTAAGNEPRLAALRTAIREVSNEGVDLLCLPGGYLSAKSMTHLNELSEELAQEAKRSNLALAVGIDVDKKNLMQDWTTQIRKGTLPWFAVCWNSVGGNFLWRQRSVRSIDQWEAPEQACSQERTLYVGKARIEILMCGEIFSQRIRESIVSRKPAVNAVVDLGHTSGGFRVHAAMKVLARGGVHSFCSVHAQRTNAQKYCYAAGGVKKSIRTPGIVIGSSPRLEIKVWNLDTL